MKRDTNDSFGYNFCLFCRRSILSSNDQLYFSEFPQKTNKGFLPKPAKSQPMPLPFGELSREEGPGPGEITVI